MKQTRGQTSRGTGPEPALHLFLNCGTPRSATPYSRRNGEGGRLRPRRKPRFGGSILYAVVTDTTPDYNTVLRLARSHDLSVYDAVYLELAMRSNLELATLESRLGQAAAREGLLMTGS